MLDSKLAELARLIEGWPGLVAGSPAPLIEDCLVLLEHLVGARQLVDVGSGGGLPGIPLKIARPDLEVVLLEGDGQKAAFLVRACAELGLNGVEVVNQRAEEAGRDLRYREAFDVAVARALAPMPVLAELCLPFGSVDGRVLAQKTEDADGVVAAPGDEQGGGRRPGLARATAQP